MRASFRGCFFYCIIFLENKWQSRDRFLAGNVPVVLESTCYICIVRSGGKHNSLCCFLNF
ncbi:hypothetical protein DN393_07915 [Bacillus sp. BPN334]|nr:hypothetical protein DN393_07915 [Bacillus sp. BPN334]